MVYYQDDPTAGESAREDPSDRVYRQIVSRIDELEESVKENISTQMDKMDGGGGKRKEWMDSKTNITLLMREQALFQKEMKKQMDQMMKMMTELQSGGGLIMNEMSYQAGGSDADSEPGSPLIRIISSDDESSAGSGSCDGSQVPLIAQALTKLSASRDKHVDTRRSDTPTSNKGNYERIYPDLPKRSDDPPKKEIQWARTPQMQENDSANGNQDVETRDNEIEEGIEGEGNIGSPAQPSLPTNNDIGLGSTLRFYPAIPVAYSAESELRLLPSMTDLNGNEYEDIPMIDVWENEDYI